MIIFIYTLLVLAAASNSITPKINFWKSFMKVRQMKHPLGTKIVGGEVVEPNSIPFQISFQTTEGYPFCGGSIMNKDTVITAAHCCDNFPAARVQIVAGEHDFNSVSGDEQIIGVDKITYHEFFDYRVMKNDVCLLKLISSLELNDKVQPVTLPEKNKEFTGDVVVSGWGTDFDGGARSPLLKSVTVQVVSVDDCKMAYGNNIDEAMICAAAPGKDSCQGDSGGPLVQDGTLVGIVSSGYGCATPGYPGIYVKVSKFIDWIEENQ